MLSFTRPNAAPSLQAALRTAIVLGRTCRRPALNLWLMCRRRSGAERVLEPTVALAELEAFARLCPTRVEWFSEVAQNSSGAARIAREPLVALVHRTLDELLIDPSNDEESDLLHTSVPAMFAQRDEDWIVPIGYAALRAAKSLLDKELQDRLSTYNAAFPSRESESVPIRDMLAGMYRADEAGDLPGFAHAVLKDFASDKAGANELEFLLACLNAWTRQIREFLPKDTSIATDRPVPK